MRARRFLLLLAALCGAAGVMAASPEGPVVELPTAESEAVRQAQQSAELEAVRQAQQSFDRGNYREAELRYENLLVAKPGGVIFLNNLGVAQFRDQKFLAAEKSFRQAIALAPNDPLLRSTLGIVYYSHGKRDAAARCFDDSLALNPRNESAPTFVRFLKDRKSTPPRMDRRPNRGDFLTPLEKTRLGLPATRHDNI